MRVLAIIPARGGSKGIPRKNLRLVAGRPLTSWSLQAALEAKSVTQIVLSSDDTEILDLAGGKVETRRRPAELATDLAPTDPVLKDALEAAEAEGGSRYDLVVTLQPTVPVRRRWLVDDCVRRLVVRRADSLLTAYPLHFVWWRENGDQDRAADGDPRWRSQCRRRPRRQDMHARELMWHEDGSVYVTRAELLRATPPARLGGRIEVMETTRTVDIDTEADLVVAEALLRAPASARIVA